MNGSSGLFVATRGRMLKAVVAIAFNFIGFAVLGALGHRTTGPMFAVGGILVAGAYLVSLRCSTCGEFVYRRRGVVAGVSVTYWGGAVVPRSCSKCGSRIPE